MRASHQPFGPRSMGAALWPPDRTLSVPSLAPFPATIGQEEDKVRDARLWEGWP
jgi:hypothetical protein